jgi:type II secretory pathway pseudopilin PulG
LLVSLGVLGLIAGLTIPSIVVSVDRSKNRSVLREAFQTISAITQAGVLNGDFANISDWDLVNSTNPQGIVSYVSSKLNYSKQCLTADTTSEGCKRGWTAMPANDIRNVQNARWILPNGAKIQATEPFYWDSAKMLWTVTTKAYGADMIVAGENPDTFLLACNIGEQPYDTGFGVTVKSGMCDEWAAVYWKPQLDKAMGNT